MSIEDRDWYREEYKKKQGRAGSSAWLKKENKPQKNSKTINEFLAGERESDKKVRDARYNPKEFRIVKASLICIFFMFLTFSATMLIFATKPTLLNAPYQIALKIINVL